MSGIAHDSAAALVAEIRALVRATARKAAGEIRRVTSGTVERRDSDGTWYVAMDGSREATPVNGDVLTAMQVGDRVSLRTEDGRLSVTGNATEPAQGPQAVAQAVEPAMKTAEGAEREAARANQSAQDAADAATSARESADAAQESADAAALGAASAQESADIGIYQLGVLEDVVGTVQWIAAHATYALTADTAVVAGKTYYTASGGTYAPTAVAEATYAPTTDTSPVDGTTYYTESGGTYVEADVTDGFAPGVTYYVATPTDPSALGLYEASVSETVQSYIASHLALMDDGLWLSVDGSSGYRMHLMGNGWEVVDAAGRPINASTVDGQGHVTSTLGRLDGLHLTVTESRLTFAFPNGSEMTEVAGIDIDPETGTSSFWISNIVVMTEMRIGSWRLFERANGNLSIKWDGE